jgi:hypothetical protein
MGIGTWLAACWLLASNLGLTGKATEFNGTWEAAAGDRVFLVLKIQAAGKISGTMNVGSIRLSDEGEFLSAEPVADTEAPFFFAHTEGDRLEFDYQDQGDNEVRHFEMRLTGAGAGELRIVDEPLRKMTPFRLRKRQV